MGEMDTNSIPEYDYLFKIVLVGESGTGKSCLTSRFVVDSFPKGYESTVGVDFHVKTIEIEGRNVKLQIWDTAGQERFRTIVPNYYRGAHGIILVYDCIDKKSFEHLHEWFREVDRYASEDADRVLVGNKCDCSDTRRIAFKTGKSYATDLGIPFYETSAKNGTNVEKLFVELAASIKRRMDASCPAAERIIRFNDQIAREKSHCC